MTNEELDAKVASLRSAGGLYLIIAAWVEELERPNVRNEGFMNVSEVVDYLTPVARSTPLEGYGAALGKAVDVMRRAQNLHDLKKVIHDRRIMWNESRDIPLDVVLAEAVQEYLEGEK